MIEYINKSKLIERIREYRRDSNFNNSPDKDSMLLNFEQMLAFVSKEDVYPITTGHWIKDRESHFKHRYFCSACKTKLIDTPQNYCPECGAKMDKNVK